MTRRRPRTTVSRRIGQRASRLIAVASIVTAALTVGAAPAQAVVMEQAGQSPLERIEVTPDLNCAVDHVLDAQGEFFGGTACGTLIASGGELFGPAEIPAGGAATPRTAYTAESQSAVTGSGAAGDPYRIETTVSLGDSGLELTQVDTYVDGEESYRTDVTISNAGAESADAILYRAGDCFLGDSDAGFGSENVTTGAIACVEGVVDPETEQLVPGDRIIQWLPISAGSDYFEDGFSEVWAAIGAQGSFPNTCRCEDYIDNGAGLSWDVTIPADGSVTRSHLTTFSPAGTEPLTTSKTADAETSEPGGTNGYTITISNPNAGAVSLDTIFDTLPAGFSYVAGSTGGLTTDDPTVDGQTLTWTDPGTVLGEGDASLSFDVSVSSTPGTYTNEAGGTAEGFTVAPTGETAPITVTEPDTEADLSITKSDDAPFGPDPVSSEGTVAYVLSVANAGPDPATEVTVVDAPEGGTVTSASGSGWTCTVDSESNTATCDLDEPLADGDTAADILVQVQAPATVEDAEISDTATVSGAETDPEPDNDSDTETTAVTGSANPATKDQAQTFYDGTQEVTLQTTRDPQGGFYSTLIIPPGLDPGVVSIDEFPTDGSVPVPGVPNAGAFCGGRACVGQFQVTVLPGGRTSAQDPITVIWIYTDGTGGNKLYVKGDGETVASEVKDCRVDGVARPAKCRDSITRLPNLDREYVMLWRDGGDPVGAKRK